MKNSIYKDKELVKEDYMNMISHSWTWEKLTMTEQECFYDLVGSQKLQGTYYQRHEVLQAMYSAYLHGLGYKPIGWREGTRKGYDA